MRTRVILYETSSGLTGSAKEIAQALGMEYNSIYRAIHLGNKVKGQEIKQIGYYYRPYELYKDGELIFAGDLEEIANKLCMGVDTLYTAISQKRKILKHYVIRRGHESTIKN